MKLKCDFTVTKAKYRTLIDSEHPEKEKLDKTQHTLWLDNKTVTSRPKKCGIT